MVATPMVVVFAAGMLRVCYEIAMGMLWECHGMVWEWLRVCHVYAMGVS